MSAQFNLIHDKKPITGRWTTLELGLMALIKHNFQNFKEFYVISDLKKYKPSMDASIYAEKIGKLPEVCEIYLKGEYICSVNIMDRPEQALVKINDGLIDKIKKN
jgi:hypothetical protein